MAIPFTSVGDNFDPLVAQIVIDGFLSPQFKNLPRATLVGFPGRAANDHGPPHLRLVDDLMSAGKIAVDQLEGMCFRRVLWGPGPHIMYEDTFALLRRMVADYARLFVKEKYKLESPPEFSNPSTVEGELKGLKVVLFSRGTSGKGRSMQGEDLLVKALNSRGAQTVICCDFSKATLEQQLAYAWHADVVHSNFIHLAVL
jgi:hypothetical protein